MSTTVRTKQELKAAVERGDDEIIVVGDLAKEVKIVGMIKSVQKPKIIDKADNDGVEKSVEIPIAEKPPVAAIPPEAVIAGMAGIPHIGIIITAVFAIGGLLLAWAIFKEYDIEASYGNARIALRKRR